MAAKDNFFYSKKTLKLRGKLVEVSKPWIMGIINLTPDSFFDGGKLLSEKDVVEKAAVMIDQGADVLDLGAKLRLHDDDDERPARESGCLAPRPIASNGAAAPPSSDRGSANCHG